MKKIFICMFTLFLLTALLIIFYLPNFFSQKFVDYISKNYNCRLNVVSLSMSFPPGISFKDTNITHKNFTLLAKKVILQFDLFQLLKTRNILNSFSRIYFVQPELILNKVAEVLTLIPSEAELKKLYIVWENGKIKVPIKNIPELYTISGNAILSERITSIEIEFVYLPKTKLKFVADKKTKRWFLNFCSAELKGKFPTDNEIKGEIVYSLKNPIVELLSEGNFYIRDLYTEPKLSSELKLHKFSFFNQDYTGIAKLYYSSYTVSVQEISIYAQKQKLTAYGIVDFHDKPLINFSGKLLDFELQKFGKIPNTEFEFTYTDNNYKLVAKEIKQKQKYTLDITAKKTVIENKEEYTGKVRIEAKKSIVADFRISDEIFQLKNFSIGTYPIGELSMKFNYNNDVFSIKDIKLNDTVFASADTNLTDGTIKGNISVNKLNLNQLIKDEKIKHMCSGEFFADGEIKGTIENPVVEFSCSVNNGIYRNLPVEIQSTGKWLAKDLVATGELVLSKNEVGRFNLELHNLFSKEPRIKSNITFIELTTETFQKAIKNFGIIEKIPDGLIYTKNITTQITTEGKITSPEVILNLTATNIDYSGPILPAKISSAELIAKFRKNFKQIKIDKFKLQSDEQTIAVVSNKIDISEPNRGYFDAIVELKNYKIGPAVFFGKTTFVGNWNKEDTAFCLSSTVKPENLWLNQQRIKKCAFNVDYSVDDQKGGRTLLKFSRLHGEQFAPSGKIEIAKGEIKFSGVKLEQGMTLCKLNGAYSKDKCNISVEGNNVDAETLLGLINTQIPLSGRTDFTIVVRGSLAKPYIAGTVNILAGEFYSIPFTHTNLQFAYSNYVMKLVNAKVVRIGGRGEEQLILAAKGEIPTKIHYAKKIDLSVQLEKGNLSILPAIFEDIKSAEGKIDGKLHLKGEVTKPIYTGYLTISDGDIQLKKYFSRLRRLNIAIAFEKSKIELREFSGRIGDGKFKLDGYLLLGRMFNIEEYNLVFYTTEKNGLKIFIPELPIPVGRFFKETGLEELVKNYSYGEPHTGLKLIGKKDNLKLTGFIRLDNTRFSYPPPAGATKSDILYKLAKNVYCDVEIKSGENTWYENELMNVNISGGLKITGKPENLIVNGRIESIRGSINYINREYEIKEAIFEVVNNECFLQAKTQTQAVFTETALSGGRTQKETGKVEMIIPRSPVGQIVPQFSSRDRPELNSEKLVQATYGITADMDPLERDLLLRKQLVQLFDSSLASPLAKSILQRSGLVDAVRVAYSPSANTTSPDESSAASPPSPSIVELLSGTKYTLEKYITGDLLFGYAITLGEMQQRLNLRHEFELAYRWKGNIFVRGIYGFEPRKTIERDDWQIRVEPQWRFGWPEEERREKREERK